MCVGGGGGGGPTPLMYTCTESNGTQQTPTDHGTNLDKSSSRVDLKLLEVSSEVRIPTTPLR